MDWKKEIAEEYFQLTKDYSIWNQIICMIDEYVMYKVILYAHTKERGKEVVVLNNSLCRLLETGFITGQTTRIRLLTERKHKKQVNLYCAIEAIRGYCEEAYYSELDKVLDIIDEKKQPVLKEIRKFCSTYIAHVNIKRETSISSFKEFEAHLEECHELIFCAAMRLYQLLTKSSMYPLVNYQGNANQKLHGLFLSNENSRNIYDYQKTLRESLKKRLSRYI